jgi:hypothetical protein
VSGGSGSGGSASGSGGHRGRLALALAATMALVACTSADRPTIQADEVPLPTPLRSWGASIAGTLAQLQAAVAASGARLDVAAGAYRPSEPASLLQLPRVVLRADLADSDDGYVVVYQAADRASAGARAAELAEYLGSGFGQTNYPADTQFSVALLDDTIIFSTWSSRRSDDPQRAASVFDAVATVGQPVEVSK